MDGAIASKKITQPVVKLIHKKIKHCKYSLTLLWRYIYLRSLDALAKYLRACATAHNFCLSFAKSFRKQKAEHLGLTVLDCPVAWPCVFCLPACQ